MQKVSVVLDCMVNEENNVNFLENGLRLSSTGLRECNQKLVFFSIYIFIHLSLVYKIAEKCFLMHKHIAFCVFIRFLKGDNKVEFLHN